MLILTKGNKSKSTKWWRKAYNGVLTMGLKYEFGSSRWHYKYFFKLTVHQLNPICILNLFHILICFLYVSQKKILFYIIYI